MVAQQFPLSRVEILVDLTGHPKDLLEFGAIEEYTNITCVYCRCFDLPPDKIIKAKAGAGTLYPWSNLNESIFLIMYVVFAQELFERK
jgi:hypothetical protein